MSKIIFPTKPRWVYIFLQIKRFLFVKICTNYTPQTIVLIDFIKHLIRYTPSNSNKIKTLLCRNPWIRKRCNQKETAVESKHAIDNKTNGEVHLLRSTMSEVVKCPNKRTNVTARELAIKTFLQSACLARGFEGTRVK